MKKISIALLLSLLLMVFVGCGSTDTATDAENSEGTEVAEQQVAEEDQTSEEVAQEQPEETTDEVDSDDETTDELATGAEVGGVEGLLEAVTPEGAEIITSSPYSLMVQSGKDELVTFYTDKFAEMGAVDEETIDETTIGNYPELAAYAEMDMSSIWLHKAVVDGSQVIVVIMEVPETPGQSAVAVMVV